MDEIYISLEAPESVLQDILSTTMGDFGDIEYGGAVSDVLDAPLDPALITEICGMVAAIFTSTKAAMEFFEYMSKKARERKEIYKVYNPNNGKLILIVDKDSDPTILIQKLVQS